MADPNPLDAPETDPFDVARTAAAQIAERTGVDRHEIAVTLGSGWGDSAHLIGETTATISACEIDGFSAPAVAGHAGAITSIELPTGKRVLVMSARTHYYEGHGVRRVVHGVRTAAAAGARIMVLTNGAGSTKKDWAPGRPVLIADHINLTANSPVEGATFVDLTDLYSRRLRDLARSVDSTLAEGVYTQFRGPHYETPAEVRMAALLGGDLVGMSTALEAIAARQSGMEILGLSLVTNFAAGIQPTALHHSDVLEAGAAAGPSISSLLARVIEHL